MNETAQRHVGMEITATETAFYFDANNYISGIPDYEKQIDELGTSHSFKPLAPQTNLPLYDDDLARETRQYPYHHVNLYQQVMGTLCWISLCHPAVAARHGELASYTHQPSARAFRVAKGVLSELRTRGLEP